MLLASHRSYESTRIFRSRAWGNAWLDVWGNDSRLTLIDIGGRRNPREMLYCVHTRLKKILPIQSLHLVGVGCDLIGAPRAEYNDVNDLLAASDLGALLFTELDKLSWSQFRLPDLLTSSSSTEMLMELAKRAGLGVQLVQTESAYYVSATDFSTYLASLGANTRLAYFNRRDRLREQGEIEFSQFAIEKSSGFFELLNTFHIARWGTVCYSAESQRFLMNFMERLVIENGFPILEVMKVNGEAVSVMFDVILDGCRYNFQSGYLENRYPKISLGAIHMGYAIETAITSNLIYDFMAGEGKKTNYKTRIATHQQILNSLVIERGLVKHLRNLDNGIHHLSRKVSQ
jgi:hypothetical protein